MNKTGDGYRKYVERRDGFLARSVSLVEIDLLLRGRRLQFDSPLPEGDCYVYLTRGDKPTSTAVYRWRLRSPLPVVPVPLRPPDPDVEIELAGVFSTTYDRGRYERRLKYKSPESTGLEGGNLAWVKSVLESYSV